LVDLDALAILFFLEDFRQPLRLILNVSCVKSIFQKQSKMHLNPFMICFDEGENYLIVSAGSCDTIYSGNKKEGFIEDNWNCFFQFWYIAIVVWTGYLPRKGLVGFL
jgi:hypothetical protein